MIAPKYFRTQLAEATARLATRGFTLAVAEIEALEEKRKVLQVKIQQLQATRNQCSKDIGILKAKNMDVSSLIADMHAVATQIELMQAELDQVLVALDNIYAATPNLPHASVPLGLTAAENIELRTWGHPPQFAFVPEDHVTLGEQLQLMDFARAAKIAGSRFVVLHDKLAQLQRALIRFMLDVHTKKHGYHEVYVPYLANKESLFGTGQLPKFRDDLFNLTNHFSLISTAEISVTNLMRDEIIEGTNLPLQLVAHTPCFRSESGSYGKDTRGMIRQHQFEKVELVRFEKPENSYIALEELTSHAEAILQQLALPYRVVTLCTGDLGFAAAKTYDLEVWLPSQNCYREISSCSNFEAFQARRMQIRWRSHGTKPELLHTLNGSGLAVGRTLVAIMENYQDAQGRVRIPEVLVEYMDGIELIE